MRSSIVFDAGTAVRLRSRSRPAVDPAAARAPPGCQREPAAERGTAAPTTNPGTADDLPAMDWAEVLEVLPAGTGPAPDAVDARTTWLTTVNENGSPHVTAVGTIRVDDAFWFRTGTTRTAGTIGRDSRCALAVSVRDADIVVRRRAERVTDAGHLQAAADAWQAGGWPATVDGQGITALFNAPGQGPAPWNV